MYRFLTKHGQVVAFGVGILITIIFYVLATGGMSEFNALEGDERFTTGIFNFGLFMALALIFAALLAMVFFGLMQVISNPKGARMGLLGLLLIGVIFLVMWMMASGEATGKLAEIYDKFNITTSVAKYVHAAIATTGILALIAVIAFVFSEVRNFFK